MTDIMHVGIEEPVKWRKEILGTAVDTIQALKEFELHRKVNKEKDVYRKHFVQVIKELSQAIQEFKGAMPLIHIPHMPEEGKKEEVKPEKIEIKKPVIKRKKTHIDKLEDDISYLREKIARL